MDIEIENINSNISNAMEDEEAHIEQLLSEKLMEGYVLLEKSCPVCSTPLVKNHDGDDEDEEPVQKEIEPVMIPKGSFTQPFKPVAGVPFCVACSSHVITQEGEISILEKCSSLKGKGGILVALTGRGDANKPLRVEEPEIIDVTTLDEAEPSHADEKKDEDLVEETLMEYSVRREIATKVLGAKMLQGYSLLEKQCDKCGMPTMEYQGLVECVVCPALIKKAKKKLKAQKKLEKETALLEREIISAKFKKASEEKKAIEATSIEEQKRHEAAVKRERERMEREAKERELQSLLEKEADQERRRQIIENEKRRVAALEAEQARLLEDAKSKAALDAQRTVEQEEAMAMKALEEAMKLDEMRRSKAQAIELEYAAATQRRKEVEEEIAEERRRLEAMEQRRRSGLSTALESMNRDVLVAEHRKRLEAKAKLDLQIARLEHDIANEFAETKVISDEKRAEDEARMIALLEEEAASKAKAAEDAIRKAKAALEHVQSARREVIAQTIALAEQEAIAEAENIIKKEREDYKAPVILPSSSEIRRENWETLRTEGRSVMTRRVMAGWVLLSEFCEGTECHSSPLITKDGKKECVVCGGCGDGTDGAYIDVEDYDVVPTDDELRAMRESGVMPDDDEDAGYEITIAGPRPICPTEDHTFEEIQQDFETKRNMVSKEIGRRMIEGWTLLDASCPHCVMPLMMDTAGNTDVCVLCGLVNTIHDNDGSTIKTVEVPVKSVPAQLTKSQPKLSETATLRTKPYTDDAETMVSTLPTMHDTVKSVDETSVNEIEESIETSMSKDLPPAPTMESKESQDDNLAESIRANAQRKQPASIGHRSDPPASVKAASVSKKAVDPAPIDVTLSSKSAEDDEHFSQGGFSTMITGTPTGHEATLQPSLTKEEVEDLVDAYVAISLDPTVSAEDKMDLAEELKRRMTDDDGVIHLEDVPSPQNFKFDMVPSEDHEGQTVNTSKKQRPTPETMGRPRGKPNTPLTISASTPTSRGIPPRPDSTTSRGSPRRPPRSTTTPRSSSSPGGSFIFTGGPSDVTSLGEMSRAESVATDALDSILDRIDAAKAILLRDDITVKEQLEAANLIEKLAQAAVAVKALERIDRY